MLRIIFVRHGDPDYGKDILTPLGHAQAEAVGKRLAKEKVARIFASPRGRAVQTAEHIAEQLKFSKEDITILPFMTEISWGATEGEQLYMKGHPWYCVDRMIADGKSNPKHVAADLLSQAEHDKMASAVLVTDDMSFAKAVAEEIEVQIPQLVRAAIARASIDDNGKIIVTDDLERAVEVANEIAPEHLEICLDEPFAYLDKIKNAGSVFLGRYCPEALGDYYAGSNHTLPTSGTARFSSALSVDDFIKKTQYIYYDEASLKEVCKDVEYFAKKEGLTAHAKSAVIRFED